MRDHLRVIKQIQEAIYLDVFVILHLERHFKTLNKQVTCPRQKGHFYKSLETFLNPTQKHHSAVTPALQTNTRQRHFQSPVNGQMTMTNNEIPHGSNIFVTCLIPYVFVLVFRRKKRR